MAIAAALLFAALRIWGCLCLFPTQEWNDVRLRAAFLIADGIPLYNGITGGPITTWMYGPVLPLVMTPATLAPNLSAALMVASFLNAALLSGAFTFALLAWPLPERHASVGLRLGVLGLSLAIVPQTFFIFLQADTAALACGLVSVASLARALTTPKPGWWWLSAFAGVAAAFSKLHGFAVVAAELGWVAVMCPWGVVRAHALRLLLAFAVALLVTLALAASPTAAWEVMVKIPARLPFTTDWPGRAAELAPTLPVLLVLPAILATWAWKERQTQSLRLLPAAFWLATLPLGCAGTLTAGGTSNSLHGAFYLLPFALLHGAAGSFAAARWRRSWHAAHWLIAPATMAAFDPINFARMPKLPATEIAQQAQALAAHGGTTTWIPWHPLATRYATGRHDHDEDGLYVRQLTGYFPRRSQVAEHLPPEWRLTLLQAGGLNWGIAEAMQRNPVVVSTVDGWRRIEQPPPPP